MCEIVKPKFVQVHCHSSYSNLDGAGLTERIVKKAKEFGHPALASTEHGSPSGLFDHYKTCKKHGVKPILGLEFYICNDLQARVANKGREFEDKDYHQSIYIKDKEGYKNFNYMTYVSFTDGYYYKPRIDFDLLFSRKKGLMATSSCIASKINNYITQGNVKDAEALFERYVREFGDDFYAEIQFNELNDKATYGIDQRSNNQFIIDMANKYGTKILIGGDVHYVEKEDNVLQDAIINSKRQAKEGEVGFQIHARHLYYHDVSDYYEFNKKFSYNYDTKFIEQCFENSVNFADKVSFEFETGKYHLPKIKTSGMSSEEYIEKATWNGLIKNIETERKYFPGKYSAEEITTIENQAEYELKVFRDMGLVDYMLMVHDIIKWEKENDIFVGAGRGSAAGSVVSWALGITGLNPLDHNLLFERFVNPNRKTMADIDWDSEMGGRERVLEYLVATYGQESVCNVATFGKYGPKSALQDMSRGLRKETGLDTVLMKKINKFPEIAAEGVNKWKPGPGDMVKYFKELKTKVMDSEVQEWISNNQDTIILADKLQGQMRNLGTHAGGIVVTPEPIYNFLPVTRGSGNLITAFSEADGSSKDLSELGILKLDVLGLQTLNVLKEGCNQVLRVTGVDLKEKIFYLPLNDQKMLDYFATGNNFGIFQMDRSKMFTSRFIQDGAKVDSFEDIVAINAMNRPGPLEKYLPKYGYWKAIDKGKIKLTKEELAEVDKERYPFEFMRKILSPTYGTLLYQEQLMQLVCELTGMNFGESDSFRRAIAWKPDNPKFYTVAKYFEAVETAMKEKGYSKENADYFLSYLRDFAGYSFNRSHSVTYSYISWQTLYFKVYYPAYFYAAMLNMEDKVENIQDTIEDAKKNGIEILPLSISKSEYNTKAETDSAIRLGYKLIKGMGDAVQDELMKLEMYKCKTIDEILQKPFKKINATALQNLINLGCFDEFDVDRDLIIKLKDLYKEPKIDKWFTRKRNPAELKTMPDELKETFGEDKVMEFVESARYADEPGKRLVELLTPFLNVATKEDEEAKKKRIQKATITAELELLGFSVSADDEFNSFARSMKSGGFYPLSEYEDGRPCYFKIVLVAEAKTKNGKTYWVITVNDGRKDFKVKLWRQGSMIVTGNMCVGALEFDEKWGWTLLQYEVVK